MQIFKDILGQKDIDTLHLLCGNGESDLPWYYYESIAIGPDVTTYPHHPNVVTSSGFCHVFCWTQEGHCLQSNSVHWDVLEPMVKVICEETGYDFKTLYRCKMNLTTPQPSCPEGSFCIPHVDYERDHLVALLYVNNADGNTIVFEEQYKDGVRPEEVNIKKEITPLENSVLTFDGSFYHTAGIPVNSRERITLNMDFMV